MGLLLLSEKEALWLTGYRQHNVKRRMLLIADSCHKAPYASERPACSESPLQLSVPCPYFLTSRTHKSFLHLLADSPFCTLQALYLPSLETKEITWRQWRRQQLLAYWTGDRICLKPGPGAAPPQHAATKERNTQGPGLGRLPFIGGITSRRLAHQLPGEPTARTLPSQPLRLTTIMSTAVSL